ncbi:CYTH domain-containing protein [Euzebyella marina]|uniref:CYTH domain-containing protein n=1 Tax=Euzebyella marina TaxID=1761453 RepID=A0A3G2L0Y2_9FLAO|nr:CYTH domain-containing protein [Euzebyella marina]AYN65920.1 CYTH domain-containing protein [Euzebyella marina]MAU71295.1 adenylate cyclase [Pseudozobellia sp.]MBG46695.1 adenylate cyclase [Pseudozobellia sp.]
MIEIERKFLVNSNDFKEHATHNERIVQGFLNTDPDRTVRVRIKGDSGFLTVKGKSNKEGTTRFEWENKITVTEAEQLLILCEKGIIDKTRFLVPVGNHLYEVDEFYGDNLGLTIAEIELSAENERFIKPDWLGDEVTGDIKYYNSQLGKKPFKTW